MLTFIESSRSVPSTELMIVNYFHLQSTLAFRPVVMPSTVKGSSQSQMILSPQIMIITGFTLACQPPLSVPTSLVGLPMSRVKMVRHFQKW